MTIRWNERMFELYDFAPTADGCGPDFEQWFGAVHPDDLAAVRASIDTMLEGNAANNNKVNSNTSSCTPTAQVEIPAKYKTVTKEEFIKYIKGILKTIQVN